MNTDESELTLFGRSDEYGRLRPSCTVGPTTTHSGTCGAPVARKRARRVREAARGNPPVETPAGRPGPTSRARCRNSGPAFPAFLPCPDDAGARMIDDDPATGEGGGRSTPMTTLRVTTTARTAGAAGGRP